MQITKYGHCCLLIEVKKLRILSDPGNYNATPDAKDLDVILITHEHQDHLDPEMLKKILGDNHKAEVIGPESVCKLLKVQNIASTSIKDGEVVERKGVPIESCGTEHACIHHEIPLIQNTGFFIDNYLFYPGDALYNPKKDIKVLAWPVSAPWLKIEETIDYARAVKAPVVFPVHDGMLKPTALGATRRIPPMLLEPHGIKFVDMQDRDVKEF